MNHTPFKLERYFAAHEFTAKHLLCSSDPESMSIRELLALEPSSEQGLQDAWLGYTEYPGASALRRELAKCYETIDPDQVIVHTGAQEAIYSFVNTMLAPGDHVIVHMPGYQSHYSLTAELGIAVSPWRAREANQWSLDVDELPTLLRAETKAILLCVPHNPTGYLPTREEFMAIVAFARRHGLILFSDEVYRRLELSEDDRLPAACDVYERAVSLGCLSKSHGLAGLRVGWIATHDHEVLWNMGTFKDYITICNSAPSEFLGTLAARHTETLTRRATDITRTNLVELERFFDTFPGTFSWSKPKAGTIAFPRLHGHHADAFCSRLLEQTGILLLPSTLLDYGNANFRIGFGRRDMHAILRAFAGFLEECGAN
ncbi:aminotransferase [Burkholderia ubonensis]|uniref:aminotransferase class I/II-fold pyridoxal phosphate-dependent enzyme n=1 Tax=Burkholderia ubonensis TaxID=101571 RepID=UPI0007569EEA|nr:aminotransferase class I/II-fold pyridoxal phosphate-dependent enzyme [Burkholderia ubonensis]KVU43893.1 aminotransferase [Burkholderia ubonensis]